MLDAGLYHMSEIIKRDLDKDVLKPAGAPAQQAAWAAVWRHFLTAPYSRA